MSPALQADSLSPEPPGKPKNTEVGSLPLLQGNFLTQESNPGLLHCRQIFSSSEPPGKLYLDIRLVAQSCPALCDPMVRSLPGSSVHGDSLGKNTGVGSHSLLQGIFPSQGSRPGLLHCRWILYSLSHQGSPRILKQAAYPFSRGSSHPRNPTGVSCIAGRFFTS